MNTLRKMLGYSSVLVMVLASFFSPLTAGAANAPAGALVQDSSGTIFFVTDNFQRRPFTSAGAFYSYGFLSFSQVVSTTAYSNFYTLPESSFIPPRDGSIFCASQTKGTDVAGECALITGGQKASFTSEAVFKGLGFSFARAQYGDSSFLAKTSNVDNTTSAHRPGVLVNLNGTVYLVGSSSLLGIPSLEVFNSWGYSFADSVSGNAADAAMAKSGVMVSRQAGQLNPDTVYLPTVATKAASDIFKTSAYLNGDLITNGLAATYWFDYGTTTSLGSKSEVKSVASSQVTAKPFIYINGLTAGTKYYFRLAGQNENGTAYGETLSFTTAQ
jgi:hypothetical protein